MADKIVHLKIDVSKILREWLFKGEKGTYLDAVLFYNEKDDQYGNCGMIIQAVPDKIRKAEIENKVSKDAMTRGPILGNGKQFAAKMGVAADDKDVAGIGAPVGAPTNDPAAAALPEEQLPF